MSSIDTRIVEMKFDNRQFEQNIQSTLNKLDQLKKSLKLEGAGKGLTDLSNATRGFNLSGIAQNVDHIASRFSALGVIGVTALANIANRAINAGMTLVKSLTIDPITAGLHEYETQLNSIQTIMANTGLQGQSGLNQVNTALQELNEYSDKTIYNFTQMARNIGTFTAAGVKLEPATAAIKGIANLAAVSGSSADQASTAMYQLSQAMASGTVKLMDWNSVVNAGMGGKVFQNSLMETARVHGVAIDSMLKSEGSFRETLKQGWLTTDILTETLSKFTGDLSAAQLKSMGYNDQQIAGIMQMAKTAQDAATKVKTFSQLIDTLQEAVGSGWAQTWQIVFGDFEEAKVLWTNVSNVLGGMIQSSAKARNAVLKDWKKLGGRKALIDSFGNVFNALLDVLKPIKEAFQDIFPPMTGKRLFDLTVALKNFTERMRLSADTIDNLKRTFRGVFAVFDILGQVIKGVIGMFTGLAGAAGVGGGGFLDFTARIGDFLVKIDLMLKQGGGIQKFFEGLGAIIQAPIKAIQALAGFIVDLFSGFQSGAADAAGVALDRLGTRLSPLAALGKRVADAWSGLIKIFGRVGQLLQPFIDGVVAIFGQLGDALAASFSGNNFDVVLDMFNTVLLGGIALLMKKFLSKGINVDLGGGMFGQIKQTFGALTDNLKAMQTQIKAKALLEIAAAVALLTISVVALSMINSEDLTKALTAMAVGFGQLLGAMAVLEKISGTAGFIKVPVISASLIMLAGAILVLTLAVAGLAQLSWNELAKGLTGVGALLGMLALVIQPLSAGSAGMVRAGVGITALAIGLNLLAIAVKQFSMMSWEEIGKGLIGVAAALVIVAEAMRIMPKNMVFQAVALTILAVALNGIALAVLQFGSMDLVTMGKGLLGVAGALLLIGEAMRLMPKNMVLQAAALVLVSVALNAIAAAVTIMGQMSWEQIGKGLVTLGGALVILAGGLHLMSGTLVGSAALLVASAALAILAPVLVVLGSLSWMAIAKGMVTLAAAFTVLGLAGVILGPITPVIMGLSLALLAVGAGLALAGAGALAFGTAFGIVVAAGSAGVSVLTAMLTVIITSIPAALKAFGEGVIAFAQVIATGGPAFIAAFTVLLTSLLTAIITVTPKIGQAISALIQMAIGVLRANGPSMIAAGFRFLLQLLQGIKDNIGRIVGVVADIISKFLTELGKKLPSIIDAGFKMIIAFINGLTKAIDQNSTALGEAGGRLGVAIIKGIAKGIVGGVGEIASAARDAAKSALDAAKDFLHINTPSRIFRDQVGKPISEGMAVGITKLAPMVSSAATSTIEGALGNIKDSMAKLPDIMSADIDMRPTIAPVLDLTQFRKDAAQMTSSFDAANVAARLSATQAASISVQQGRAEVVAPPTVQQPPNVVSFEQNNYSPKALSNAEIYRQTKNQISQVKGALKTNANTG